MTEEEAIAWVDAMAEKYYTPMHDLPDPEDF
jgi:hypothetical protein